MPQILLEYGSQPFPGFRLLQPRGKGGFAEVWEAENPQGQHIALKFFISSQTTSTVKEVKSLTAIQKLEHPHILRMHQVWSVPGYIVVAMELAEGSLIDFLDAYQNEYRTCIDPTILCYYLSQAAEALDFLNKRQHTLEGRSVGWQHCDIKPSNLLLIGDNLKIADFGLSTPTTGFTNPLQSCGTPDFAAPEIYRDTLSEHSDQYSLAITYYYLRTGRFPFPAFPRDFARHHSYSRPEPDLQQISPGERKVLLRALNLQPEKRWRNCTSFLSELQSAIRVPSAASTQVAVSTAEKSNVSTC